MPEERIPLEVSKYMPAEIKKMLDDHESDAKIHNNQNKMIQTKQSDS